MRRKIKRLLELLKNPLELFYIIRFFLLMPFYQKIILPPMVKRIRRKKIINVLFIINELGSWKTESLFLAMLHHHRFCPHLLLVSDEHATYSYGILKNYLDKRGYNYFTLNDNDSFRSQFNPDIIFYQKPYLDIINPKLFFHHNLDVVFCYALYCFCNRKHPGIRKHYFLNFVWQFYAENEKVIEEFTPILYTKGKNLFYTGLPFMDDLLKDKATFKNPWKKNNEIRKRIIYAPHHTISTYDSGYYKYGTFLDYCFFILELAEKYSSETQWAFKPHPLLKMKLTEAWGENKTNEYYQRWEDLENGQVAEGDYMDLFKHSDAMIHDCGSFKLEYLYTGNPVLYLIKEDQEFDYPNWQTQEALNLHYQARCKEDIEVFIKNVINNVDVFKEKREHFVKHYLTPPYAKSACENIINAILGEKEFSNS